MAGTIDAGAPQHPGRPARGNRGGFREAPQWQPDHTGPAIRADECGGMVRVTYVDGSGHDAAAVELDDFTVKTLHPRLAEMLASAVSIRQGPRPHFKLSKKARPRHSRTPSRTGG